ncbi:skin secretory protein xP2-like [Panicum hallii]|uniref:skin secretory protein xP2-like n=1 Tax=Panicum hallii TaxID=206008 RepID=UPI000DF4EC70|nr:skin secretory protein xP2-like [Panicum hallii]
MPTLDEGGLAVRQLGGDPNRGLQIPGAALDRQQRTSEGPGEPGLGGPAPAGKGKEKVPVPEHRYKDNKGAAPAQRDDKAQGAAPAQTSQAEGSKPQFLEAPIGGSGPQPALESSASAPAGPPPWTTPETSGPRGLEPEASVPPRPDAAPQEEDARPAAATEAPAVASGAEAGPSPAEPAAEGAAPAAETAALETAEAAETAAPEAAEVTSAAAPPAEEEEPEVVLGRPLLPSAAEIPLPRLLAKCQQAQEELEAGIRREWEKLDAEYFRLSDWERRLGDRIKSVTARHAEERAKLALERELLQEKLQKARDREVAAFQREKAALPEIDDLKAGSGSP